MIWIADDEKDLLTSLCKRLELRGFATRGFFTPGEIEKAIEKNAQEPQMNLVDFSMRAPDGKKPIWEFLLAKLKNVPLYIMTGHGSGNPAVEGLKERGVAGIFHKPLSLEKLMEKMKSHQIKKREDHP